MPAQSFLFTWWESTKRSVRHVLSLSSKKGQATDNWGYYHNTGEMENRAKQEGNPINLAKNNLLQCYNELCYNEPKQHTVLGPVWPPNKNPVVRVGGGEWHPYYLKLKGQSILLFCVVVCAALQSILHLTRTHTQAFDTCAPHQIAIPLLA